MTWLTVGGSRSRDTMGWGSHSTMTQPLSITFEKNVGFLQIRLVGELPDREITNMRKRFDGFIQSDVPSREGMYHALWLFHQASFISERSFAELVGLMVYLNLRRTRSILVGPTHVLEGYLLESGLKGVIPTATNESEAMRIALQGTRKEYTSEFFSYLIDRQFLTRDQLRRIFDERKRHENRVGFESLLLDSGQFNCKSLVSLHAQFQVEKLRRETPEALFETLAIRTEGPAAAPAPLPKDLTAPPEVKIQLPLAGVDGSKDTKGILKDRLEDSGVDHSRPKDHSRPHEILGAPPFRMEPEPVMSVAPVSEFVKPRLMGQILIERGLITDVQLMESLRCQREEGRRGRLGDILVRLGYVTDEQIFVVLEDQYERRRIRRHGSSSYAMTDEPPTLQNRGRLGELLCELGILSEAGLRMALNQQKKNPEEKLGAILLRLGIVTRDQILDALHAQSERKTEPLS